MKFFPLIWSNLKRRKLRTTLTLLSIVVAFLLFGLLASIKHALTGGVSMAGVNRLVVQHRVSIIQLLPVSYKMRMERIPGVDLATHQTWFGGKFGETKVFFMQNPVDPADFLSMHPEMVLSPEEKKRWLETRTGAIVGKTTADRFKWKVGDRVPIFSPIWRKADGSQTWYFDIVGIFTANEKNADTMSMFFRYDYFDEARAGDVKGLVGWYTVRVKDSTQAAEVAKLVDKEFENSDEQTKTAPEAAFAQAWAKQIGNIAFITASILGAVFFTILLVTGNTMSQAVRERTGELGVLKTLGFTNQQVLIMVMAEACLIALLGGAIGLGLARAIIVPVVGKALSKMLPLFSFPPRDLLLGVAICIGLGVITGIFPALAAMRLRVADSLRRM